MRLRPALIALAVSLCACARRPPVLAPFRSDGCTLFPDKDYLRGPTWCSCCVAHDSAYWLGGSDAARRAADDSLRACVERRTGDKALAAAVWAGVRAGGSSLFPTWYRWGYGWPYGAKVTPADRTRESRTQSADIPAADRSVCGE
jgi:hypothetical protein